MDVRLAPDLTRRIHNGRPTAGACYRAAAAMVPGIAAATPVDTGDTAGSTRAEGGHRSTDGRSVAARVVQGRAGVQQQFGNAHETTPARQFDRGAPR